jgi:hypothetical protein
MPGCITREKGIFYKPRAKEIPDKPVKSGTSFPEMQYRQNGRTYNFIFLIARKKIAIMI